MTVELSLCGIRQKAPKSELNLSNEAVSRELDSDFQKLNGIRGIDIRSNDTDPKLRTIGSKSSKTEIRKTFWFRDVIVSEEEGDVHVEFKDGHKETFEDAEIWTKYESLELGYYDKPVLGAVPHPSTGTVHIVDKDVDVVCGRCDWVEKSDVEQIRTTSDDLSYNSFCSQCSHKYDGVISKAADLSVPVEY